MGRFAHASLTILALLAVGVVVLFMTLEARGSWSFIIPFRGRKVLGMALVGLHAASTVMFQTITNNRILTPIMGFDALYMLIQTCLVFFLGSNRLLQIGVNRSRSKCSS